MSGHWPPGWDDPDDNIPERAGKPDTEAKAGLSEVAAYLASVPAPLMPGSVEARISAALAVEAASRAGITAPADGTVQEQRTAPADQTAGPRVLGPVPDHLGKTRARARERVFQSGARGQRGGRDRRRALGQFVLGPLVVCLLLAVIGFGLSRIGSASSSSGPSSVAGAPAALPAAGSAASSAPASYAAAPASSAAASAPREALPANAGPAIENWVVSATGTSYQQATLAEQARAQLLAAQSRESVPSPAPTAGSPSSAAASPTAVPTYAASVQLRACVLKATGGALPELIDRATYQGTPVYVIASSSRVWVVGRGCTAANPEVITSQPLGG